MQVSLDIAGTESTPSARFFPWESTLRIEGESYPENFTDFFGPILEWLRDFPWERAPLKIVFRLFYLNTSSAMAILDMVRILEDAQAAGADVEVVWQHEPGAEMMRLTGIELFDGTAVRWRMNELALDFH